jgi:hypothetical protein
MPNIGTRMFGQLLDALLLFAPNCCQIVYLEPSPLKYSCLCLLSIVREFTSTSLPLPLSTDAVPGPPRHSLRCWSSPSLLSRYFLRRHCHCLRRPTAAASAIDVVAVSAAAATYLLPWSRPVALQKSILVDIYLTERLF